MPKEHRERIDARQQIDLISAPVPTKIVARPVDTAIAEAQNHELNGLVHGLAALNPALEKYVRYQDINEEEAGGAARRSGESPNEAKSAAWVRGYMRMDGLVKGQEDAATLQQKYQTEFDKDTGYVETFITQNGAALTKGMQDGPYREGYVRGLAPVLEGMRKHYVEYHRTRAVEKTESNAMVLIENGIREAVNAGKPVGDEFIEAARANLSSTMGVTGSRFNALLFASVKRVGDEGNFAIYDMFKRNRPDGTPGMYFIPEWKEKIDAAQIHAQSVFLKKANDADVAARRAREEKQETALYDVFEKAFSGDIKGANVAFSSLKQDGLFSRASDLIKWEKLLSDTEKREARPEQQDTEANLLSSIYKGRAGINDVLGALSEKRITNTQARSLLSESRRVRTEERTLANAAAAAGKAIFRSPEFTSGEQYIKGILTSQPSQMDPFGIGTQFDRQQRASAELEFTRRASTVSNPHELHAIRDEIADRYLKRRKQFSETQKELPGAGLLRYSTPAEAAAAARAGLLNVEELAIHHQFFKQGRNPR